MTKAVELGDIIQLRKGKKATEVHEQRVNGASPYIQIDEVRGATPQKYAYDAKGVTVTPADLCIVWDGANAGTVGYGVDGLIGSTVARMRIKAPEEWDTEFVGRLLQSRFRQLNDEAQARGATIPHVDKSKLEAIELPRIDRSEQQRIAAILDKADGIRKNRDRLLQCADEFVRSSFLERFGHPLDPDGHLERSELGKHCDFFAGGSLPRGEDFVGQEGGLLLIKVSDLNAPGNEAAIRSAKLWAASRAAAKGGVIAPRGSVVFPKWGGAIATNKKRVLERDCVLDPNLMAVAPKIKSHISNNYIRTWFELIDLASISSGSSVPQLNKKDLSPLAFGAPDRESVEWFDGIFERANAMRERLRVALSDAETLFASLSQRAFRGEL
jgi:type I restriction enzyme S subunit